jgi:hypothetical protein
MKIGPFFLQGEDAGELRQSLLHNVIDIADRVTLHTGVPKIEVVAGLIEDLQQACYLQSINSQKI